MEIISDLKGLNNKQNLVVALGNFDGIHLGHQELINRVKKLAGELDGTPAVFTFDPHPLKVLRPDNYPPLLLTKEHKIRLLAEKGIKVLFISDFSHEIANLKPQEFIKQVIIEKLKARAIIVGYNFTFGKGGKGTPETLIAIAEKYNLKIEIVPSVKVNGTAVSSTLIRKLLLHGEVEQAGELLGYRPFITGRVIGGAQLGRELGFPTANLAIPEEVLVPANGVYVTKVIIRGQVYFGVANIGTRPTLKKIQPKNLEVHILNFDQNIYDVQIMVQFIKQLRKEKRFADLEELKKQIVTDVNNVKDYLESFKE